MGFTDTYLIDISISFYQSLYIFSCFMEADLFQDILSALQVSYQFLNAFCYFIKQKSNLKPLQISFGFSNKKKEFVFHWPIRAQSKRLSGPPLTICGGPSWNLFGRPTFCRHRRRRKAPMGRNNKIMAKKAIVAQMAAPMGRQMPFWRTPKRWRTCHVPTAAPTRPFQRCPPSYCIFDFETQKIRLKHFQKIFLCL